VPELWAGAQTGLSSVTNVVLIEGFVMARVSRARLENLVKIVAEKQGRPLAPWAYTTESANRLRGQRGALQLDHNPIYGGWDLVEIANESGGENSLIGNTFGGRGRLNAHEMESFLLGMLAALQGTNYWPVKAD